MRTQTCIKEVIYKQKTGVLDLGGEDNLVSLGL